MVITPCTPPETETAKDMCILAVPLCLMEAYYEGVCKHVSVVISSGILNGAAEADIQGELEQVDSI